MPTEVTWEMTLNGAPLSWDSAGALVWDGVVPNIKPNKMMASHNRISLEITPAQKTAIVNAVAALKTALDGITINLTKDDEEDILKTRGTSAI